MKAEIHYRPFEEVVDAAKLSIPHLNLEGAIDPQQLLQTIIKINYDLGLKVSQTRTKMLPVKHGRTKLPAGFRVANYAVLCHGRQEFEPTPEAPRTYSEGVLDGVLLADQALENSAGTTINQYTRTLNIQPGNNLIEHNLNSADLVVQAATEEGEFTQFRMLFTSPNTALLISDAEDPLLNVRLILIRGNSKCEPQPQLISTEGKLLVRYQKMFGKREEYHRITPLRFVHSRGVSADCLNLFRHCEDTVTIQDGFLIVSQREGSLLLSYQSVLEDDEGNLLTLDHPKVNNWYDYAIKEKIFENLYLSGEDVLQKLQYIQSQLRPAKVEGLSFINTPDFGQMREVHEMNRKAQIHNYYSMFMS